VTRAEAINWARQALYEAGINDRLRELSDGLWDSYEEAIAEEPLPVLATEEDP
jgi:hypothetical protein